MPRQPPIPPIARLYADLGEDHGESLFNALNDIQFWIKDRFGRYIRVNDVLLANYGFNDAAQILGKTDQEVFPPHLASQYVQDDRKALAGVVVCDRIELVARPDHSLSWHVTNKIPLRSRRGRIVATAGITRDLNLRTPLGASVGGLQPVIEQLRRQFDQPLDRAGLARLIGLSVRSLERRFAATLGTSLLQYQRKIRMHQACQQLVSGLLPITTIALDLGYGDHSHFTREFHRTFGVTPRDYRKRWYRAETVDGA